MSYEPEDGPSARRSEVEGRVAAPAVALMVSAIISIAGWIGYAAYTAIVLPQTKQAIEQQQKAMIEQQKGMNSQQMQEFQKAQQMGMNIGVGMVYALTILGILVAIVIFIGALKMKNLQSYGFAMTASILAIVPCI